MKNSVLIVLTAILLLFFISRLLERLDVYLNCKEDTEMLKNIISLICGNVESNFDNEILDNFKKKVLLMATCMDRLSN